MIKIGETITENKCILSPVVKTAFEIRKNKNTFAPALQTFSAVKQYLAVQE